MLVPPPFSVSTLNVSSDSKNANFVWHSGKKCWVGSVGPLAGFVYLCCAIVLIWAFLWIPRMARTLRQAWTAPDLRSDALAVKKGVFTPEKSCCRRSLVQTENTVHIFGGVRVRFTLQIWQESLDLTTNRYVCKDHSVIGHNRLERASSKIQNTWRHQSLTSCPDYCFILLQAKFGPQEGAKFLFHLSSKKKPPGCSGTWMDEN